MKNQETSAGFTLSKIGILLFLAGSSSGNLNKQSANEHLDNLLGLVRLAIANGCDVDEGELLGDLGAYDEESAIHQLIKVSHHLTEQDIDHVVGQKTIRMH